MKSGITMPLAALLIVGSAAVGAFAGIFPILILAAVLAIVLAAQGHGGCAAVVLVGLVAVASLKFFEDSTDYRPSPITYEVIDAQWAEVKAYH